MCKLSTPDTPAVAAYAPEPEPIADEPVLDAEDAKLDGDTANVRAKRRGARSLRTDLGISNTATGLNTNG